MRLSVDDVEYVAALARVHIREDEKARLTEQLSTILSHIDMLRTVDTSAISPTSYATVGDNVMRSDVVAPSFPVAAMLSNAPDREGDQLKIDAVFDQ